MDQESNDNNSNIKLQNQISEYQRIQQEKYAKYKETISTKLEQKPLTPLPIEEFDKTKTIPPPKVQNPTSSLSSNLPSNLPSNSTSTKVLLKKQPISSPEVIDAKKAPAPILLKKQSGPSPILKNQPNKLQEELKSIDSRKENDIKSEIQSILLNMETYKTLIQGNQRRLGQETDYSIRSVIQTDTTYYEQQILDLKKRLRLLLGS